MSDPSAELQTVTLVKKSALFGNKPIGFRYQAVGQTMNVARAMRMLARDLPSENSMEWEVAASPDAGTVASSDSEKS